jgi:hypothetical protein
MGGEINGCSPVETVDCPKIEVVANILKLHVPLRMVSDLLLHTVVARETSAVAKDMSHLMGSIPQPRRIVGVVVVVAEHEFVVDVDISVGVGLNLHLNPLVICYTCTVVVDIVDT